MVHGTKLYDVALMTLLLYTAFIYTESSSMTTAPCGWGEWLPWNCSCCGNSVDKTVYRVRAKCCEGTPACWKLRVDAANITAGTNYLLSGQCSGECAAAFHSYSSNSSKCDHPDEITGHNKKDSCQSECTGSIPTTVTTKSTTYLHSTSLVSLLNSSTQKYERTVSYISPVLSTTVGLKKTSSQTTSVSPSNMHTAKERASLKNETTPTGRNALATPLTANCRLVLGIAMMVIVVMALHGQ